jgi:hypothetical protein
MLSTMFAAVVFPLHILPEKAILMASAEASLQSGLLKTLN